ncbi:MAG: hypothetical protein ACLGXA_23550 [Acidobacteriota bacterium]
MRYPFPFLICILACALQLPLAAQSPGQPTFPSITSYNLNKQKVTLPSQAEGQIDLLLLSFRPEQQTDINSWLPAAQALQHLNFQFRYYQIPVAEKENFVFRWWESSSMRSDQTDPETWQWIVPVWLDRKKFFRDLGIPNDKQVVALLIDRQGKILWRASGPMTADKRAALTNAAGAH